MASTLFAAILLALFAYITFVDGQQIKSVTYADYYYNDVVDNCNNFINFNNLTDDEIVSISASTRSENSLATCTVWYRSNRTMAEPPPSSSSSSASHRNVATGIAIGTVLLILSL